MVEAIDVQDNIGVLECRRISLGVVNVCRHSRLMTAATAVILTYFGHLR